jgi:prepilin-type N-terminal cleavage/methylation domain-containing protein
MKTSSEKAHLKENQSGFTLLELVVSMTITAIALLVVYNVFSSGITTSSNLKDYIKINLLLKEKSALIKGTGFWIWNVNTINPTHPNNAYDPAIMWANDLAKYGYTKQAIINTTFLKESGSSLVPFSGNEFDGNLPRNVAQIDISLYNYLNQLQTKQIILYIYPSEAKVKALLTIIKQALEQYRINTGSYPNTGSLSLLVPNYLAEIPNDPYTATKEKTSHTEEATDWYYENNSGTITICPYSHY